MIHLLKILAKILNALPKTDWKPIPLCDTYRKYDLTIPNLVGHASAPTVTTGSASSITSSTFTMGGEITSTGGVNASTRGFCYVVGDGTPTTANSTVSQSGSYGTGTYSLGLSGLSSATLYSVRAYAINSAGTAYGSTVQVSTLGVPVVTTSAMSSVAGTSATGNGNVTNTGGSTVTTRGFCYMTGTSGDPTTADSTAFDSGSFGTGAYTKSITGLNSGGSYRVRAYAVNSTGTGYGTTVQLTLLNDSPAVALNSPSDASSTSDSTPDLTFTGTDPDGDDVRYNVQVDTLNTFSSVGALAGTEDVDGVWTNEANAVDGLTTTYASVANGSGSPTSRELVLRGTTAPTSGDSITSVQARIYAESFEIGQTYASIRLLNSATQLGLPNYGSNAPGWSGYVTLSTPSGGWNWPDLQTLEARCYYDDFSNPGNTGGVYRVEFLVNSTNTYYFDGSGAPGTPLINATSGTDAGFSGTPDNTDPFASAQQVTYTVQAGDTLADGTYYWRARAIDPSGSNAYGAWSVSRSFTIASGGPAADFNPLFMAGD